MTVHTQWVRPLMDGVLLLTQLMMAGLLPAARGLAPWRTAIRHSPLSALRQPRSRSSIPLLCMPPRRARPLSSSAVAAAASTVNSARGTDQLTGWAGTESIGAPQAGSAQVAAAEDDGGVVDVFEVLDVATAEAVVKVLLALPVDTMHACDTEVSEIDITKSPLGQGTVICLSVYSGPTVDYGRGPGQALWVDTSDEAVLKAMRPFLECERCLKVWHNYGFDRHVLYNHGIDVRGFGGDTMHMARLWDASRLAGYVRATPLDRSTCAWCVPRRLLQPALCGLKALKTHACHANGWLALRGSWRQSLEVLTSELLGRRKAPMKELFGVPILKKDGTAGKKVRPHALCACGLMRAAGRIAGACCAMGWLRDGREGSMRARVCPRGRRCDCPTRPRSRTTHWSARDGSSTLCMTRRHAPVECQESSNAR